MDISELLGGMRRRNLLEEVDEIISPDMNEAFEQAMNSDGKFGPVVFKADTLDKLLAFSETVEREDGNVSLQGALLRKMAKTIYDKGENQFYADIMNLHSDTRALLEISKEAETAFGWRQAGYQTAARIAREYGLPKRADMVEKVLDLAKQYHEALLELQKECPCYNLALIEEAQFDKPDYRPKTGDSIRRDEEKPLVEA